MRGWGLTLHLERDARPGIRPVVRGDDRLDEVAAAEGNRPARR